MSADASASGDASTADAGSCFSMTASAKCGAKKIEMKPEGWARLTGEVSSTATFGITVFFQLLASGQDPSILLGMNSLRCAIVNSGDNAWYFIASAYYFLKYFEQEQQVVQLIEEYYPVVCTCRDELMGYASWLVTPSEDESDAMSSCSEAAINSTKK